MTHVYPQNLPVFQAGDYIQRQVFARRYQAPTPQAGGNVTITYNAAGPVIAASSSGVPAGTSNPGSPASGDLFFRTDLGLLIYYDGTRWLTVTHYEVGIGGLDTVGALTATGVSGRFSVRSDFGLYLTRWHSRSRVTGTSNSTNRWVAALQWVDAANTATTIASYDTGTAPDTTATWTDHGQNINAVLNASAVSIHLLITRTASTSFRSVDSLSYRLIVP